MKKSIDKTFTFKINRRMPILYYDGTSTPKLIEGKKSCAAKLKLLLKKKDCFRGQS